MRLRDAVTNYLQYLRDVARRSPATIRAYERDLSRFADFVDPDADLEAVDVPQVETWVGTMRHRADATVRRALNAASGLFAWAVRFRHATDNPLERVQRPRKRRRIQPSPKPQEVAAMLAATRGETERAALLALATSGLRRAELLGLNWPDVDLPNRRLRIRGKGDKDREAIIFEELLAALYALHAKQGLPTDGPVFRGRRGKRLQKSTLQRWFNAWSERAGLRDGHRNRYTLHSLRRFAAKRWLDCGLNIRQVQLLLGHQDLQTTILYLNYDLDEIARDAASVDFGLRGPVRCGG